MSDDVLVTEDIGRVRLLRLNRPQARNALDARLWDRLNAALAAADADESVGAIVISGGRAAFCSGQDLHDLEAVAAAPGERAPERFIRLLNTMCTPTVGAVCGMAVGIGFTMLALLDATVAGRSARGKAPFVDIGLSSDGAASVTFVERAGWAWAFEVLATAAWVDAEELLRVGLVSEVVDDDDVERRAVEVAAAFAAKPFEAVAALKRLMIAGREAAVEQALQREVATLDVLLRGPAHRAAVDAFVRRGR